MSTHHLKILPEFFEPVKQGLKTFEVRYNDRNFQIGDTVILKEFDPFSSLNGFTGREIIKKIIYVLKDTDFAQGLNKNFCIFSIGEPDEK